MIAKLQSISYLSNALSYCERGGELLHTNQCFGAASDINLQMEKHNHFNDKCLKNTFHVKIRIAPEDIKKLNTQDWIDISIEYAKKIGFADNPFAVYIHEEETEKEHIHIIASRIKSDNKAVKDNYTHYKNMDFCRAIEEKYNLRKVSRVLEVLKKKTSFVKDDHRILPLELKIKKAINQSDSIDDFVFHLDNMGIKTTLGRGIGFTDEKGVYFKGSDVNRKYSLSSIKNMLTYKEQEKQEEVQKTTRKIQF